VDKRELFGKGKLDELTRDIRRHRDVTAVVIGIDMLSALQLATLQQLWGVSVYDRSVTLISLSAQKIALKKKRRNCAKLTRKIA